MERISTVNGGAAWLAVPLAPCVTDLLGTEPDRMREVGTAATGGVLVERGGFLSSSDVAFVLSRHFGKLRSLGGIHGGRCALPSTSDKGIVAFVELAVVMTCRGTP